MTGVSSVDFHCVAIGHNVTVIRDDNGTVRVGNCPPGTFGIASSRVPGERPVPNPECPHVACFTIEEVNGLLALLSDAARVLVDRSVPMIQIEPIQLDAV